MSTLRNMIAVTGGCAFGIGVAFLILHLGTLQAGVWIAVAAALVLILELLNALRRDKDRRRRGRDAVWQRRIEQVRR